MIHTKKSILSIDKNSSMEKLTYSKVEIKIKEPDRLTLLPMKFWSVSHTSVALWHINLRHSLLERISSMGQRLG